MLPGYGSEPVASRGPTQYPAYLDCSERCPSAVQVAQIGSMTLASPPGPSQGLHSESKSQLPTYLAPMGSMMLASPPGPRQAPAKSHLPPAKATNQGQSNYRQPMYLVPMGYMTLASPPGPCQASAKSRQLTPPTTKARDRQSKTSTA